MSGLTIANCEPDEARRPAGVRAAQRFIVLGDQFDLDHVLDSGGSNAATLHTVNTASRGVVVSATDQK